MRRPSPTDWALISSTRMSLRGFGIRFGSEMKLISMGLFVEKVRGFRVEAYVALLEAVLHPFEELGILFFEGCRAGEQIERIIEAKRAAMNNVSSQPRWQLEAALGDVDHLDELVLRVDECSSHACVCIEELFEIFTVRTLETAGMDVGLDDLLEQIGFPAEIHAAASQS